MNSEQRARPDFFISYASADRGWAEWIAWQLEQKKYVCCLQAWDFTAGAHFVDEINKAIRDSRRTVAVLSQAYLESAWTKSEVAAVLRDDPLNQQRRLLPVRVGECLPDALLASIVYIDLVGVDDEAVARRLLLDGADGGGTRPDVAPRFPPDRRPPAVPVKPEFPPDDDDDRSGRAIVAAAIGTLSLGWVPRSAVLAGVAAVLVLAGIAYAVSRDGDKASPSLTQVGVSPRSLAIGTGPADRLWIADPTQPEAWWLHDTTDGIRTDQAFLTADARPTGVALDAPNDAIWVADEHNDRAWRISVAGKRATGFVALAAGASPQSIAVDGDTAWVASGDGTVSRIGSRSGDLLGPPIKIGQSLTSIAAADGVVWATDLRGAVTWRIDARAPDSARKAFPSDGPRAVAVGEGAAWIANRDGTVSRIGPAGHVTTIEVSHDLCGVAVGEGSVWVSDPSAGQVWRIDPGSNAVGEHPVQVEDGPCAIAAGGGSVWVANRGDSSITRFKP